MPFDQKTRNLLQRTVTACRKLLDDEFAAQRRGTYGINDDGTAAPLATLTHLPDEDMQVAQLLRNRLDHLVAGLVGQGKKDADARKDAVGRLTREQAFTVLNRLAALRMAEERGIVLECVRHGLQSEGFLLFQQSAGSAFGDTWMAYRAYLFVLFDELTVDLGVLFSRWDPAGLLFPRQEALEAVLGELGGTGNAAARDDLTPAAFNHIWAEDETIGWIYQYYNDPAERKKMRDESAAPRNSRELAVRNQFFTPRYVVEFLTDNTLGRIWYEMTQGNTRLKDQCRYLVKRRHPIFLSAGQEVAQPYDPMTGFRGDPDLPGEMWIPPNRALTELGDILRYGLTAGGYDYAKQHLGTECSEFGNARLDQFRQTGKWDGTFEELRCCLFFEQRRHRHIYQDSDPSDEDVHGVLQLHQAVCDAWDREVEQVTHRPLKDPRTILMIDPACGSLHFGLYAFDLFEVIYEEAWDLETVGTAGLSRPSGMPSLHECYATKDDFLRDVPRLIIEHNIHGIDIDPRCAQIAGLSLWLRAQKSWQRLGLTASQRPTVTRSNIVCAEPMPGEKELLREFVEREFPPEERGVFLRLLEAIFDKMQLAGEAGSLLKIEEEIKISIEEARRDWQTIGEHLPGLAEDNPSSDLRPLTSDSDLRPLASDFWEAAESRLLSALRDFAEQAENGGGFQRRLFAEDAARGFAFIDVCRKRYDVALMNPPFGDRPLNAFAYLERHFPDCGKDIYAAFISRGLQLLNESCRLGAITSRSGFFLSSIEDWRNSMFLSFGKISEVADLGYGVLDAKVETAAYCVVRGGDTQGISQTLFIKVLGLEPKGDLIRESIDSLHRGTRSPYLYTSGHSDFINLPGKPFAYSAPKEVLRAYAEFPAFESDERTIRAGVQSSDDFRFLRSWWEIPSRNLINYSGFPDWRTPEFQDSCRVESHEKTWIPFVKGGEFSPFYSDVPLVINWKQDGAEVKEYALTTPGTKHWSRKISSADCYFRPGLTYLARTSIRLCATQLPAGAIISNEAGPGILLPPEQLRWALGRFNSMALESLTAISQRRGMEGDDQTKVYGVGALKSIPWPPRNGAEADSPVSEVLDRMRGLRGADELSKAFFKVRESGCEHELAAAAISIWKVEQSICQAYGFDVFQSTQETLGVNSEIDAIEVIRNSLLISDPGFSQTQIEAMRIAYVIGCAFGRWDIRYAAGEKAAPELPDPFAPLPVCSPGQLQNAQGLPVDKAESGNLKAENYPIEIPWDGILVDDANHPLDIERRVREVIEIIWGGGQRSEVRGQKSEKDSATPESIEHEACEILSEKSLREYFRKPAGFFADHLKRYSKSRRQAPIYWPLSTASGSYTLWIYYHRLDGDTLYKCLQQFVEPKIKDTEDDIHRLRTMLAADEAGTKERKQLADAESLLTELRALHATLSHWAPRWKPNLNDGVVITASPLWELFRLPKWQKTLKETWQELEKGDYDWAHLALTLWPERVREKCKKDRSLAIAHKLEELCEIKAPETKKKTAKKAAKKKGTLSEGQEQQPELLEGE